MTSDPQTPDVPAEDGLPPQGMRTAINFLLFMHLFTVGMLILFAGSSSPAPQTLSLRQQLRRIPGYYLQVLGMDMDFDSGQRFNRPMEYGEIKMRLDEIAEHLKFIDEDRTRRHRAETALTFIAEQQNESPRDPSRRGLLHLTHGGALDTSHSIDLLYVHNGENRRARLPQPEFQPYQRYLRFQMLAREMARLSRVDSVKGILPTAVATWMIRQNDDLPLDEKLSEYQPRLVLRRRITQLEFAYRREKFGVNVPPPPENPFWYIATFDWTPCVVSGRLLFNEVEGNMRDYAPAVAKKKAAQKDATEKAAQKKKPKEESQ